MKTKIYHPTCHNTQAQVDLLSRTKADEVNLFAGKCFGETAKQQNQIALATGKSESRVSRVCSGDEGGAPQRFYKLCYRLASHPKTDPGPLIAGVLSVIEEAQESRSTEDVRTALLSALRHETDAEGDENNAEQDLDRLTAVWAATGEMPQGYTEALERYERACRTETAWQITAATLARVLRGRLETR